jgi:predicted nucleic acid-binding protein
VTELVLDAPVVLKWFHTVGEPRAERAQRLRKRYASGEFRVLAPPLLWLELINVAARRWQWEADRLQRLAAVLPGLGFELLEPDLAAIARWCGRGLTAYDAAYVALAEEAGAKLITDDAEIVRVAPSIAVALSGADLAS